MNNTETPMHLSNITRYELIEYAKANNMYIYEFYSKQSKLIIEIWLFENIDPKFQIKQKYYRYRYFYPEFDKYRDAEVYACGMFMDYITLDSEAEKWYIDSDRILFPIKVKKEL